MANRTDPTVTTVHGTNPQFLVEKILRQKIYNSLYWKEHCFGLTAETLVDKAVGLSAYGGQYGGMQKPTKIMCLILKMLQLQPEKEIVVEFIKNEDYKYLRVLGAFYLRLVGKPLDIYQYLEPLYNDYRKLRFRGVAGWALKHMDEYIEELLTGDYCCDVALPHLPKRHLLEDQKLLTPRISALEDEDLDLIEDGKEGEGEEEEEEDMQEARNGKGKSRRPRSDDEEEEDDEDEQEREKGDKDSRRRHRRDRSASPQSRDKRGRDRGRRAEGEMDEVEESHARRRRSASRSPKRRRRHSRSRSASRSRSPRRSHRDHHDDRRRRRRSPSPKHRRRSPSPSSSSLSSPSPPRKDSSGCEDEKRKKAKKSKSKKVPVIRGLKLHKVAAKAGGGSSSSSSAAAAEGGGGGGGGGGEKSVGEWNEMRAKLGLKPLQE